MKIETPWHTEHQLDQLAGQFEHWRHTRSHPYARIPEPLWDHAVELTATLSPSRVAKHLGLRGRGVRRGFSPLHPRRSA